MWVSVLSTAVQPDQRREHVNRGVNKMGYVDADDTYLCMIHSWRVWLAVVMMSLGLD